MHHSIKGMQLLAAELGFAAEQEGQRSVQHFAQGLGALVVRDKERATQLFELADHEQRNAQAMAAHRDKLLKQFGGRKLPRWVFLRRLWNKP